MPTYQVVRCANDQCAKYQSQQQKKANKWSCVVCGLKQSLKRVYFESTKPKECRAAVMELNMQRGKAQAQKEEQAKKHNVPPVEMAPERIASAAGYAVEEEKNEGGEGEPSKWAKFEDEEPKETEEEETPVDRYNRIVVGQAEKPQKKRRATAEMQKPASVQAETSARYSPYPKKTVVRRELSPPTAPKAPPALQTTAAEKGPSKWGQFAGSDSEEESDGQ
ncbi:hypothetical protein GGI23_000003 [Coemansia sp. RSA 2559]|nr:hypothetical protein GGI23_000003 [Coemansia sp. RSA 2559]KAJ2869761.1 hypothetical protein GGI22_000003 [Coemansia erecta]